jgi:mono/diheme cytochrome c family protein
MASCTLRGTGAFACGALILGICVGISSLPAQEKPSSSVWDGIYSDAQAARGAAGYREACKSCHGDDLDGKGPVPPLAGSDFTGNWNGMSVGDLFEKMQTQMPADRPGQLSKEQNAAVLAYILQYNKFPAGKNDLPGDARALEGIRFEAKKSAP